MQRLAKDVQKDISFISILSFTIVLFFTGLFSGS